MTSMTRAEAQEALANAEIESMDEDTIIEELKKVFIYGNDGNVPYCDMDNDAIIQEYEDVFDDLLVLI